MPTYDYRCVKCNKVIEIFHSMTDESKRYCKICKGELHRILGIGGGFIFKGKGFFRNDYPKGK